MHRDGDAEENHRGAGRPGARLDPAAEQEPDDEGGEPTDSRDPGCDRGPSFRQARPEVAGEGKLQGDPGAERNRQHERTDQSREDARATGERECKGDEACRAPRLRDRDRVGEVRKHPDEQLDAENRERPAEHERGPALPRRQRRERDEHERGYRNRAATRHDLRPQRIAVDGVDVQLVGVLRQRAAQLVGGGRV